MVERNAGVPPERRIEFRIGIHLGDVVEESDGDLMGDGVNIAARLEGICEPGGVCLSEDAYRQVRDRLERELRRSRRAEAQEHRRPMRVYALPRRSRRSANPPRRPKAPRARPARQAFDRRAAVPEHERRPGAGLFRRRNGRGHRHRPVAHQVAVRHRAQFELRLQGQGGRRPPGRPRARRALRARGRRAQGRRPPCASRRSSSRPKPARICGPTSSTARSRTSSTFRTRSPIAWSAIVEPSVRRSEIERSRRKRPESLDAYDLFLRALPHMQTRMPEGARIAIPLLEKALETGAGLCRGARASRLVPRMVLHARRVRRGRQEEALFSRAQGHRQRHR